MSRITFLQTDQADTPSIGSSSLFVKADQQLYLKTDQGVEKKLSPLAVTLNGQPYLGGAFAITGQSSFNADVQSDGSLALRLPLRWSYSYIDTEAWPDAGNVRAGDQLSLQNCPVRLAGMGFDAPPDARVTLTGFATDTEFILHDGTGTLYVKGNPDAGHDTQDFYFPLTGASPDTMLDSLELYGNYNRQVLAVSPRLFASGRVESVDGIPSFSELLGKWTGPECGVWLIDVSGTADDIAAVIDLLAYQTSPRTAGRRTYILSNAAAVGVQVNGLFPSPGYLMVQPGQRWRFEVACLSPAEFILVDYSQLN